MLAVPLDRQFEQVLNARYLEKLGYGKGADDLRDPKTVHEFLEVVPDCRKKLASYTQNGNQVLFGAVDEFIDKVAAGVI
jgi:hypothetical protein